MMTRADIKKAARLLKQYEELRELQSELRKQPADVMRLGLYAHRTNEDGTMYADMRLDRDKGLDMLLIAADWIARQLRDLGVEDF